MAIPKRDGCHYFEQRWKPKSWGRNRRFVLVSQEVARQNKEPLQLDLFRPVERSMEFKVILTNHTMAAGKLVSLHEGRGRQEKVLGELKSQAEMRYVPCRFPHANQTWLPGGDPCPQSGQGVADGAPKAAPQAGSQAHRTMGLR